MSANKSDPYICFCNKVSLSKVQASIAKGALNLAQIYDACGAGTGPCGGSCRQEILRQIQVHRTSETPASTAPTPLPPLPAELIEGVSLFNRRYFWEAHEILEDLWMEERGQRKIFYQAIIQAAASLYHVLNANPKGVIKLAEESLRKLAPFRPQYSQIHVEELCQSLQHYLVEAKEILGAEKEGFNYDRLPQLQIGDMMDGKTFPR